MMNHITIQCANLDASIKFYEEIVGLKIVGDLRGKNPKAIVFMAKNEGETTVELIDSPEAPFKGEGISIGFGCDDVEGYREKLAADGLNPTPIIQPNPHVKFFFVKDPDGMNVQFI